MAHGLRNKQLNRIESVDTFRFLAIAAVVAIHTNTSDGASTDSDPEFFSLNTFVDLIARFGVPFFFVIAGYFWGAKIRNGASPIRVSRRAANRLILIFIAWSTIYIPFFDLGSIAEYGPLGPMKASYWHLLDLINNPITLVVQGTKGHLWFLMGLLCSIAITTPFVQNKNIKTLVALSISLYFFGLLAKAYSASPFGISIGFNTRNGPFFGTIFFVSGYLLSELQPNPLWLKKGLWIASFGYILHFLELFTLWRWYGVDPHQDYVLGTYFVGIGTAIAALSNHPALTSGGLVRYGQLTLGIYATHYVFVDMLRPLGKSAIPFWGLWYFFLVLSLSVVTAVILSRNRVARHLVL
jgi:surface polysaccharide O-acyltransferase-like enzyme